MKKGSGGDGIPVELFQILKDNAVKVLHSICQQIWNTQQWPQDWKGNDGGVLWVFSSWSASMSFLTRYDGVLREPLVWY